MTATRPLPLLRAALAAAGRGWPVFPLIPGGKRPAIAGWPRQATVDAEVLAIWWRDVPYNIGIACGPAGLLVVDLDGPPGRSSFTDLAAEVGSVPTFTVGTPSGGEHRYFTLQANAPAPSTVARLGPHIDTRGAGGYVVAPGSARRTVDGFRYYRITDPNPPAVLPDSIAKLLRLGAPARPRALPQLRRRTQQTAYGRAAIAAECTAVGQARPGTRNTVLFQAAVRLGTLIGSGILDGQHVQDELLAASTVHCGINEFTTAEEERAIANGLRYGAARPRPFRDH